MSRSREIPGSRSPNTETRAGRVEDDRRAPAVTRRAFLAGGVGVVGTGTAEAQEDAGGETVTVELVDYAYEPGTDSPLSIEPGTTVNFVWITDNHNINVDTAPDGAEWEGHEPIEDADFEYEHTFEVEGTYEFHCDPHLNLGMEGTITVGEGGGDGADGGPMSPIVPEWARGIGVAAIVALVTVVFLFGYFFLKYGGYEEEE